MTGKRHLGLLVPALILVAGMVLTLAATWQLAEVVRARNVERFQRATQQVKSDMISRLDLYVQSLRGAAGLVAATGVPDRQEFRRYVDRLRIPERLPGVQGIGFSLRIADEEFESVVERLRRDDSEFTVSPAGERPERHAIVYLEPLDDRNRRAIGFDMASDPVRRAAMERACDSGDAAASGRVTLLQETDERPQAGFLIYLPVYRTGDIPASVEERRRELAGFVYSPFRADDFFDQVEAIQHVRLVDFDVFDGDHPSEESRLRSARAAAPDQLRLTTTVPFEVAGRAWTVAFSSRPRFVRGWGVVLVLGAVGVAFTLLLFAATLVQHRARARAEETALQIHRSGHELRRSEARLRAILDSALDSVISMDAAGTVTEWNAAATRTFGYARDEAVGRSLAELIIPAYLREHHHKGLAQYLATGEGRAVGRRLETMAVRSDGSELPVELSIVPVGEGAPMTFTGFVRDISERRRAEKHRELMTRELDHRVKNNLWAVVALVDQTANTSDSFGEFVEAFSGRVRAMARLHEMLAENRWTGADLDAVVRGIMTPYMDEQPSRISVTGEPVDLPGNIVSPLCLALHELATNAAKYGSLSVVDGSVEICWKVALVNAERRLHVHWRESNGPPVTPPRRRGFGTELVERGLAYEVRADSKIQYEPDGVRCDISLAIPQTATVVHRPRRANVARV